MFCDGRRERCLANKRKKIHALQKRLTLCNLALQRRVTEKLKIKTRRDESRG